MNKVVEENKIAQQNVLKSFCTKFLSQESIIIKPEDIDFIKDCLRKIVTYEKNILELKNFCDKHNIKLYVLITVVSIVLLAWLLVVVIVFQKNHADIFFFDNNKEIEYQYGNYKADALVVDGYVYLYRSVVELGNYDKKEKLEKCGNNVIYRLSPDGTYEEFYEFEDEDALYYDVNSKLYYYDEHFYIMIGQRVYRITKDGSSAQVIYENTGGNGIFRMFGIREHYLLLANHNEVRYLDMRKWDWSTPIDFDQMRVLKYVYALDADTFYNWMISGVTKHSPKRLQDGNAAIEEETDIECINIYQDAVYYVQENAENHAYTIKYKSLTSDEEEDLLTVNPDGKLRILSLVVSEDFIIYDLGSSEYGQNYEYGENVDVRIIWNRHTGKWKSISYK